MKNKKLLDRIGEVFNNLTIIDIVYDEVWKRNRYLCRCTCGNITTVDYSKLKSNSTVSCGCVSKNIFINRITKHSMRKTRFYRTWAALKDRCLRKSNSCYDRYGAKGVNVCEEWLDFNNFKEDMYESYLEHVEEYGEKETTIDRKDSTGNYCKENCRWATYMEQNRNKSTNKKFKATSPNGEVFFGNVIVDFHKEHNIAEESIRRCLQGKQNSVKGWKFERLDVQ